MIHIFNRRELVITRDNKMQADTRDKLSAHNIAYIVKTSSYLDYFNSSLLPQTKYEYRIYVKKSDYELAQAVFHGKITYDNKGK